MVDPIHTLNGVIELTEVAAPAMPASGYARLYVKTDNKLYFKNDAGTESDLTASSSSTGSQTHKSAVKAASVGNLTLSGTPTIDDVTTTPGDRILIKDQTTAANNGIYVVAAGAWSRATDADTSAEVLGGMQVWVNQGTVNADSMWTLTTNDPITLGSTSLTFTRHSPAGSDTEIQYNSSNVLAASSNLTWNNTTKIQTISAGQNAATGLTIANSTNGTDSQARLLLTSTGANPLTIGKVAGGFTGSIGGFSSIGNDGYVYSTTGDLILTTDSNLKLGAGNTAIADMTSSAAAFLKDITTTLAQNAITKIEANNSTNGTLAQSRISAVGQGARNISMGITAGSFTAVGLKIGQSADITVGSGSHNQFLIQATENIPIIFGTNNTERMRINTGGNIDIGGTAAGNKLTITTDGSAATPAVALGTTADANTGWFHPAADTQAWSTGGTEVFRITSTQDLGIGVTPTERLSVKDHSAFATSETQFTTGAVQTTDATQTSAKVLTLADNTVYWIEAHIAARETGGTDRARYIRSACVYRQGAGAATIEGTVDTIGADKETAGASAWDATFTVSSNDVRVSVTGAAATTINWVCTVRYQGVSGNT